MCTAGSRIFVQEGIYDKFVEAFTEASQSAKVGDLFDPTTTHTPVVSQVQFDVSLGKYFVDVFSHVVVLRG